MTIGSSFLQRLRNRSWYQAVQAEPQRVTLQLQADIFPEPLHMPPYPLRKMVVFRDGSSVVDYGHHRITIDAHRTSSFLHAMQASLQAKMLDEPPTFFQRLLGCNWREQLDSVNAAIALGSAVSHDQTFESTIRP